MFEILYPYRPTKMRPLLCLVIVLGCVRGDAFDEENYGVKYANDCEVCKIVSKEILMLLKESEKKREVLETGYSVQKEKKKTKYANSELRLIETLDSVCEKLLEYRIHKERKDSTRFDRGMSETFRTLEGLVAKGVKVDLGMPQELWHKPSAEISHLKTQCEALIESHEEDIEDWYFSHQTTKTLEDFLCRELALKSSKDKLECLDENKIKKNKKSNKKSKGDTLNRDEL